MAFLVCRAKNGGKYSDTGKELMTWLYVKIYTTRQRLVAEWTRPVKWTKGNTFLLPLPDTLEISWKIEKF